MTVGDNAFAVLGEKPVFDEPVPIGQLYYPSAERYREAFQGVFDRQYYTNNGPLLTELEHKLQNFLGVKHVICVSNATFGLMIAVDAMNLTGKVILPSFTFVASAQSLSWAGVKPVFCDIDPVTHQIAIDKLDNLIDEHVSGIMGVNLWGGACNPVALENYAKSRNLHLYFDSAHAFGCVVGNTKIANFGNLEVFSFHATKILSAAEGGCICTNNDELAASLRGSRPSYNQDSSINVARVANARMSEAQAAIALMSLEDFPRNQKKNERLFRVYDERLKQIPGVNMVKPSGVTFSNFQYLVCEIDETVFGVSRDLLISVLKAENVIARRYFYPGVHRTIEYSDKKNMHGLPVTENLCMSCIQLPIGAMVDDDSVEKICNIIQKCHKNSKVLNSFFAEKGQ